MLTLNDIIFETKGKLVNRVSAKRINGVSIDSRTLQPGDVFVAVKGLRYDGHKFLPDAIRRKASVLVVSSSKIPKCSIPVVRVQETIRALGQLARFYRRYFGIPVIAVTGSNGKTTTKELIAAVLAKEYNVLKNEGTQNNFFGVPLTLLQLNKTHDVAVLEFGSNHPGEIASLTQIAEPNVAVLTNIGDSHLAFFKNRQGVFKEKTSLVKEMPQEGVVVINNDDPYLQKFGVKDKAKERITYGIQTESLFRAVNIRVVKNSSVSFQVKKRGVFILKTLAAHNVSNALAAISCGYLFQLKRLEIVRALEHFCFPKGRQTIQKIKGITIIDDTYNANPTSVKSVLLTFDQMSAKRRKVIVFGDMLELGRFSKAKHLEIGQAAACAHPDLLIVTGRFASSVVKGFRKKNKTMPVSVFQGTDTLSQFLKRYLREGDIVLIKGSRGLRLDRVVDFLKVHIGG